MAEKLYFGNGTHLYNDGKGGRSIDLGIAILRTEVEGNDARHLFKVHITICIRIFLFAQNLGPRLPDKVVLTRGGLCCHNLNAGLVCHVEVVAMVRNFQEQIIHARLPGNIVQNPREEIFPCNDAICCAGNCRAIEMQLERLRTWLYHLQLFDPPPSQIWCMTRYKMNADCVFTLANNVCRHDVFTLPHFISQCIKTHVYETRRV